MKLRKTVVAASITALLLGAETLFAPAVAGGQTIARAASVQPTVGPNSPAFAPTLEQLEQAERADKMNSTSWEESDPRRDDYYARKADQTQALINRLEGGDTVSAPEIDNALKEPRY